MSLVEVFSIYVTLLRVLVFLCSSPFDLGLLISFVICFVRLTFVFIFVAHVSFFVS